MAQGMPRDDLRCRVEEKRLVTPVIMELFLRPVAEAMEFVAGQYALLCDAQYQLPQRSYSIANAPWPDGVLTMLVTRVPGGATSTWVHDRLAVGDEVLLSGPYGTFVLPEDDSRPLLLLSGGSGIAPMRALAEAALSQTPGRSVLLVHSARTQSDRISASLFETWAGRHSGLRHVSTLTRDPEAPLHGRVPDVLPGLCERLDRHEVYIAGSPGFVVSGQAAARRLGAAPERVHVEPFFVDPQPWLQDPGAKPSC